MAKIYSKTQCEQCGKEISNNNIERHYKIHTKPIIIKNKRGGQIGRCAWNKGLTKETDNRVLKNAESVSKTFQKQIDEGTFVVSKMGFVARQKLSEKQSLCNSGGRAKWFMVAGKSVQGTYEKQFAEKLEEEQIVWEKVKTNNHVFKYKHDEKIRSYAPDFFLPEFDLYIEIKGLWWGDDENKMKTIREQHLDKKLVVIFGKEKLDMICINIKKYLPLEPVWSW
jgi:ribosome-associated protein YbcJ (S4-like RNA binding protein)